VAWLLPVLDRQGHQRAVQGFHADALAAKRWTIGSLFFQWSKQTVTLSSSTATIQSDAVRWRSSLDGAVLTEKAKARQGAGD
jgi:hypothetical protein